MQAMTPVVQKFSSHKAAEAANDAYYRSLTPQQCLDIMLDLIASQRPADESANRLAPFVELLNARAVKYVIVGGYAVAFHGHPRFTGDIDIFVESSAENANRLVESLNLFGFGSVGLTTADFQAPDQVIQLGYPPNRIDILTGIDAIAFGDAYASRIEAELDGLPTIFISKPLLIKNKEAAGREQDLADLKKLRS